MRFVPATGSAPRGRLADLRREVQMMFGASLLGVATVSCVPRVAEPRSTLAATPKPASPTQDGAAHAPNGGGHPRNTANAPQPGDGAPDELPGSSGDAPPAGTVVAIYGSSSVAIHDEVTYAPHSLVIDADGERTLAALKEALTEFDCDIVIQGHAGRDEANAAQWLSKRRAELVRERLIALGVAGGRLSVEVRGASPPRAANPPATERDRRVSFLFHARGSNSRHSCDESDRRKP